jgi:hypothetical protein
MSYKLVVSAICLLALVEAGGSAALAQSDQATRDDAELFARRPDFPIVPAPGAIQGMVDEASIPPKIGTRLKVNTAASPAELGTSMSARAPNGKWVGTLSIHPALLARPTDKAIDFSKPTVAFGLPRQMARWALEIDGSVYELLHVDETTDEAYKLRHVTMAVLNQPGSYARFSVQDSRGLVYGTLYTPQATYRVVPNLEKPEQFVYRLDAVGSSKAQSEAVQVDWLAKRHQQVEAVGEIQPDHLYVSEKIRAAWLTGGRLGKMRNATVAEFTAAMRRLSALSQVTGREVFRLRQVQKDANGGTHAEFEQLIGGVPTFDASEVYFDASGNIHSFRFKLVPEGIQPLKANISEQEAYSKVIAQWEYQYGAKAARAEQLRSPRLYYTTDDAWASYRLEYEFRFSVGHTEYHANTNAVTGDISIVDLTKH